MEDLVMSYDWREDVESVRDNFGEWVKGDDEALRILNIVRFEMGIKSDFTRKMRAVREILRAEGHDVPFRVGGYRKASRKEENGYEERG
jgi:hypothetical protein